MQLVINKRFKMVTLVLIMALLLIGTQVLVAGTVQAYSPDGFDDEDFLGIMAHIAEDLEEIHLYVLDAVNFEGGFYLLLQLLELKMPVLVVLNRGDLARGPRFPLKTLL